MMCDLKRVSKRLNNDLGVILNHFETIDEVNQYLKKYLRFVLIGRYVKWTFLLFIFVAVLCSTIYYSPTVNWNVSAIGRLSLIKLILPYFNWQYLYNSRCLVSYPFEARIGAENYDNYGQIRDAECDVCENLGNIERVANISYSDLQSNYLLRDLPVIVSDSHDVWPNQLNVPDDFIEFIETIPMLRYSEPCNVVTNLLQTRNKIPNLQKLLRQIKNIKPNEWFLHFRNCDFEAVKASRSMFPLNHRPYFMSSHLPPFHSSWILLSNHYKMMHERYLPLKDLVFVFQLSGQIFGRLDVQRNCNEFCTDHEFHLKAGESLLFNAEMWNFYYYNKDLIDLQTNLITTFIQEIQMT